MPRVGLFIPCYVDQLFPQVGLAALELLERFGCDVEFPAAQTCCGQPMANTGCVDDAKPLARRFLDIFRAYDHIVCSRKRGFKSKNAHAARRFATAWSKS